jgi:Uncharacterised nucleotidyltransferase
MKLEETLLHKNGFDLSIEFRIILCCARTTPNLELLERIADLTRQITDWDYVLRFAAKQGLLLFLVHNINRTARACLPQTLITNVRRGYASRSRSSSRELCHIASLFAAHGIKAISYKGPTLSGILYKTHPLRPSGDLDYFVHPRDYNRVKKYLLAQGYVFSMNCGYKYHLWHPIKQVDLDLHKELAPRWYKFTLNFDHAWERSTPLATRYGGSVPTFCLEDLVIVLCLDLVKDIAQPGNFRLLKITDIAELLKYTDRINWTALTSRVKSIGLSRVMYFGLLLADRVYGVTLPPKVRRTMESHSRLLHSLVNLATRMMLDEKSSPPVAPPRFLHEARTIVILHDHLGDQLFVMALYLIRPVRLCLKYLFAVVANFVRAISSLGGSSKVVSK